MRNLFAVLLILALPAAANETSVRTLQSGSPSGGTPLHDRGIRGEDQIIAVLDTGLDWMSCYFAEPDSSPPPYNTGSPGGGLAWQNVDPARRKVIAYDFLYSCDQFPNAPGCETPGNAGSFDNQGHGTHAAAAAAGDRDTPGQHDYADAIAPMAKLVIQDAGFIGGDNCSQRPGIGCPVQLTPILEQAYRQGARIHSNSWGDRQGTSPSGMPPTANYPASARDVDAFVWSHPDILVVFNTGNYGATGRPPANSLSAPGSAKNTLQIGGTRPVNASQSDDYLATFTLYGPTRDGRIKPDLVGPARVLAGDVDLNPNSCDVSVQAGTSWASPSIAGAAALVRQYYTAGFHPTGTANAANRFTPSAALLKATLIAAARPARYRYDGNHRESTDPTPSFEQGWGFPVLDNALFFAGDAAKLRVDDVPLSAGLAAGQSNEVQLDVRAGVPLKIVLVWTDPAGVARGPIDPTPQLVNDLDLRVTTPAGTTLFPNRRSAPDRLNNVETVILDEPFPGRYRITIDAHSLGQGPRQSYALVVTGDFTEPQRGRSRVVRH